MSSKSHDLILRDRTHCTRVTFLRLFENTGNHHVFQHSIIFFHHNTDFGFVFDGNQLCLHPDKPDFKCRYIFRNTQGKVSINIGGSPDCSTHNPNRGPDNYFSLTVHYLSLDFFRGIRLFLGLVHDRYIFSIRHIRENKRFTIKYFL